MRCRIGKTWVAAAALLSFCCGNLWAEESDLKTYHFMVFADPTPGMETEFNRWYDEVHAPEVIAGKDFISAQRFALSDVQLGQGGGRDKTALPRYMILYVVKTRDIQAVLADMQVRLRTSPTNISSPAFDPKSLSSYTFTPAGKLISAADVQAQRGIERAK